MSTPDRLGGIIHTYQKFDPINFPSPTAPPPDVVSPAFEHLLFYGNTRRLTEEELARAVHLDPSQIRGLGPAGFVGGEDFALALAEDLHEGFEAGAQAGDLAGVDADSAGQFLLGEAARVAVHEQVLERRRDHVGRRRRRAGELDGVVFLVGVDDPAQAVAAAHGSPSALFRGGRGGPGGR